MQYGMPMGSEETAADNSIDSMFSNDPTWTMALRVNISSTVSTEP